MATIYNTGKDRYIVEQNGYGRVFVPKYTQLSGPTSRIVYGADPNQLAVAASQFAGVIFSPQLNSRIQQTEFSVPEFQVGTHQRHIADLQSRGQVFPTQSGTGARPPSAIIDQTAQPLDPSAPNSGKVWGPAIAALAPPAPVTRPFTVGASQASITGDYQNVQGSVQALIPPSAPRIATQQISVYPQDIRLPEGYAFVLRLPQPSSNTAIANEWYASQDWPEERAPVIETKYTPLFPQRPSPILAPQLSGNQDSPEALQPNESFIAGQVPTVGGTPPLRPILQVHPQQYDQGYGLTSAYGWSRLPPISVAPDIPRAYYSIPQAAPQQLDYLQANESHVVGQQPTTAASIFISPEMKFGTHQKNILDQQAYGAVFGTRKPPSYFINVKMVPGEDNPEQPSGSAGSARLWTIAPPSAQSFETAIEIQIGTHQKDIADQHSRGWVVPRLPSNGAVTPLKPIIFAAPQQTDEGRALINRQPPPSAIQTPRQPWVFAFRVENFENDTIISTEPLVPPVTAPALGPALFAFSVENLDQPAPELTAQQLNAFAAIATIVSQIYGAPQQIDLGFANAWGPQPQTATRPNIAQLAARPQDADLRGFSQTFGFSLGLTPPELVINVTTAWQEVWDSAFTNIQSRGAIDAPRTTVPIALTLFVPAELPDQNNVGAASLSKPFLPLPVPPLRPAISSTPEHRDIADSAGYIGQIYGPRPPTGGYPPFSVTLFSAPDQIIQAHSTSGGSVRGVWVRNVPSQFSAPHMLPLGFGLLRLGGIQLS